MQEKIKWYQEVLELEPGSKVFFPLARLLVQTGQIDAALQTLQLGLGRHPEFIEARLYLIDVLFKHQRTAQCDAQVSVLTDLFASYTGFWQAWGAYLSHNEQGKEASLALTFLAASFQNPQLRLADIFTQGLQSSLLRGKLPASPASCAADTAITAASEPQEAGNSSFASHLSEKSRTTTATDQPQSGLSAAPVQSSDTVIVPAALATNVAPLTGSAPTVPPLAELVQSLPSPRETGAPSDTPNSTSLDDADIDDADDSEDGEERFSLRTRSMAEVLAEQGDFKNALDIYQELTALAVTPEEQLDLQHRISTLTARMGSVQGQSAESPVLPDAAPGKHRLLSLLETLAVRFEAHAQG